MNQLTKIAIILLLTIIFIGCQSTTPPNTATSSKTPNSQIEEGSVEITAAELAQLNTPDERPNADAEAALAFIKRYQLGQSLAAVRQATSPDYKLKDPTTNLPRGELPEDQVVVEFKGKLHGYYYFQGTPQNVGVLLSVEVFVGDGIYGKSIGKDRIRAFNKLLGKPARLSKDEDEDVSLYLAEWPVDNCVIRYEDIYDWGSTISINNKD